MANLLVRGGTPLNGEITPSGNKNAVLPMLCASLLTDEPVTLTNVPDITDIGKLITYFRAIGSTVEFDPAAGILKVQHSSDLGEIQSQPLPLGIRSAVLLLAPVLYQTGRISFDIEAKGCALGVREIDPHIEHLISFGAQVSGANGVDLLLSGRPIGHDIWADYASVTATETFAMIASVAAGRSVLTNAASEPHVQSLCQMLIDMGAKITGFGTSRLTIEGAEKLRGTTQRVPDDHHEVATFLALGGVSGGKLKVKTDMAPEMPLILNQFSKLGLRFETDDAGITVTEWTREVTPPLTENMTAKIEAAPWPYFPADLLPQAIGVAVGCKGDVMFWNKVYEGALGWSGELAKLGVRAHLSDPHRLIIFGNNNLHPGEVEAPYIIRVVVGLLIAAIQIDGPTRILNADPLRRAHPNLIENLVELGADIQWEAA